MYPGRQSCCAFFVAMREILRAFDLTLFMDVKWVHQILCHKAQSPDTPF
jgi:hypothetical protein